MSGFIAETVERHVRHLSALQALDAPPDPHPADGNQPYDPTETTDELRD
ncbi:MAG TPA: hypothetical protein VEA41_20425 [Salinarimonas sp.]|nr:hypothetical protein [Salinarimonas sp.]